jgi:hypothetical protein
MKYLGSNSPSTFNTSNISQDDRAQNGWPTGLGLSDWLIQIKFQIYPLGLCTITFYDMIRNLEGTWNESVIVHFNLQYYPRICLNGWWNQGNSVRIAPHVLVRENFYVTDCTINSILCHDA